MRIIGTGLPDLPATTLATDAATAGNAPAAAAAPAAAPLQSAVLQPALAALKDMPDIDQAKVEALRDALSRGEMPFNPARLAGLISRFHGNRE
ncbi:MAG: flagellar biosynthesis anti-sigma factor FlgM [Actinomycetota bacterium]